LVLILRDLCVCEIFWRSNSLFLLLSSACPSCGSKMMEEKEEEKEREEGGSKQKSMKHGMTKRRFGGGK